MTTNATQELVEQVITACPKFCEALTTEEVATFVKFTSLVEAEPNQVLRILVKWEKNFTLF